MSHQEQFATISQYCSGAARTPPLDGPDQGPGMYLHFGGADNILPLKVGLDIRSEAQTAGYRYVCRIQKGVGHDYGPKTGVALDNLRWMHQSRNRHVPLDPEQQAFFNKAMKDAKSAESTWANAGTAAQALYIGGHYAQAIALKAIDAKSEAVRINIAKAAANGLLGVELLREMGKNLKDKSAVLRKASIAALAPAANWNWPEAKELLLRFASEPKNVVDERCAAVQALVDATAILVMCDKYEDSVIIPGLVQLLDDPALPVRGVAFAGLSRLNTDSFGYDPSAKDRKKPLAAWKAWATEKCAYFTDVPLPRPK